MSFDVVEASIAQLRAALGDRLRDVLQHVAALAQHQRHDDGASVGLRLERGRQRIGDGGGVELDVGVPDVDVGQHGGHPLCEGAADGLALGGAGAVDRDDERRVVHRGSLSGFIQW